jgi:hypothetical protein
MCADKPRATPRKRPHSENGHAALYVLLLLPIVVSFTVVAVDVSAWNALRDKLQQQADTLALQAANALPDTSRATAFIASAPAGIPGKNAQVEVFFPDSRNAAVGVRIHASYEPAFAFFLSRNALHKAFTIERSAVAQVVPGDYALILADGASLRPPLLHSADGSSREFALWGSELDWPAADYFSCVQPERHPEPNVLQWPWWNDWNRPDFKRWATQSCFNPAFTPLKLGAIALSDALLRLGTNRLALIFTPGGTGPDGYRIARHIQSPDQLLPGEQGGFPEPQAQRAQSSWGGYEELDQFLGDEVCMLISSPSSAFGDPYRLPYDTARNPSCSEPLRFPSCSERHHVSGHFSDCYLSRSLTIPEAIYWDAAKLSVPGFSAEPDIPAALHAAWNELLTAEGARAEEQRVRGNLALHAVRHVTVLSDHLPDLASGSPSLEQILDLYRSAHIDLALVLYHHQGLSPAAATLLETRKQQLEALLSQQRAAGAEQHVRIFEASDPQQLQQEILPQLASLNREIALKE